MLSMISLLLLSSPSQAQDDQTGSIQVLLDGAGGEVFIDGEGQGVQAPGQIDALSPGEYFVEVKGECSTGAASAVVTSGEVTELRLVMEGGGGLVQLSLKPAEAELQIDGDIVAPEEMLSLPCGQHQLLVSATGFETYQENFEVSMGDFLQMEIELSPKQAPVTPPPAPEPPPSLAEALEVPPAPEPDASATPSTPLPPAPQLPSSQEAQWRKAGWALEGVGLGLAIGAAVFYSGAVQANNQAQALWDQTPRYPDDAMQWRDEVALPRLQWSRALMISGGLMIGGGTVVFAGPGGAF